MRGGALSVLFDILLWRHAKFGLERAGEIARRAVAHGVCHIDDCCRFFEQQAGGFFEAYGLYEVRWSLPGDA